MRRGWSVMAWMEGTKVVLPMEGAEEAERVAREVDGVVLFRGKQWMPLGWMSRVKYVEKGVREMVRVKGAGL
jgi:hypothetical protein